MTETSNAGNLADDLRTLMDEAEALLRTGLAAGGVELQDQAQDVLADLKARLAGLEKQLNLRVRYVDGYVRDNPWQAVAITGGVALLLGLILARR
jgi:ElaB/YqjD/DUF883 family membrane-anchored ribosome-binding protein